MMPMRAVRSIHFLCFGLGAMIVAAGGLFLLGFGLGEGRIGGLWLGVLGLIAALGIGFGAGLAYRLHLSALVALKERRIDTDQFRILVDGVTDFAIYMLDVEGRVTTWNSGAERIK